MGDVGIRKAGHGLVILLLSMASAVWLESIFTMKWVYANCSFPMFGWPLPNRHFSECCSLEWGVDWKAYLVDLSLYFLLSLCLVVGLRVGLRKWWKWTALPFAFALIASPLPLIGMTMWYSSPYVGEATLRPAGFGVHVGYGACKGPL